MSKAHWASRRPHLPILPAVDGARFSRGGRFALGRRWRRACPRRPSRARRTDHSRTATEAAVAGQREDHARTLSPSDPGQMRSGPGPGGPGRPRHQTEGCTPRGPWGHRPGPGPTEEWVCATRLWGSGGAPARQRYPAHHRRRHHHRSRAPSGPRVTSRVGNSCNTIQRAPGGRPQAFQAHVASGPPHGSAAARPLTPLSACVHSDRRCFKLFGPSKSCWRT